MTRAEEIDDKALEVSYHKNDDRFVVQFQYFEQGAEWADKTMIDKACEWLSMNISDYIVEGSREGISLENQKQLINDFRKAMEE